MSEQFDVILGGLDTEVDVTIADSTGVDPSVLLALRGEKGDKGDTGATGQDGTDGVDGADGFSPIATVSKVGDTATITITDKDGTTTATISDGASGTSAFEAEFGTTTYADVKDAYDDGEILICTVPDGDNTMTLQLVYFDDTNEIFFFAFPTSDGWYWTQLSNVDGWDDGQFYFASTDTATQLRDGLMTALDKQKLDGIASGAEVNVQSDWNQSTNTADDYIKNKPTKLSQFINDSGYITGYTETDPVFSASAASGITSSDISDWNSKSEVSVTRHTTSGTNIADLTIDGTTTKLYAPTGGGGTITDVEVDGTSVVTGGVAEIDLTGKSDVGHTHTTSAITDFPSLATVATSGDYDDLTDKPTIPSNVSDLVNDSGFITSPNVVYCTCGTATSTVAKEATIVSGSLISLTTGAQAIVKFTYANSATNPTLKVGSTTAKNIKKYGSTAPGTSGASSWQANSCILFVYDGTDWQMCDWNNTTYSEISSTNIKSSSSSSTGLISGRRAKAAVDEFAPVKDVTVGGTSVMSGTTAVVPAIPTDTGDLTNGAGYITGYTETDPIFTASAASGITSSDIDNWDGKQDELVSEVNIRTINGTSVLGSGDISVSASGTPIPTADTVAEFDSDAHINSDDMSAQDVSDFVDGLNAQGANLGDYVVEQGTDANGWYYRKWNSGYIEADIVIASPTWGAANSVNGITRQQMTIPTIPTMVSKLGIYSSGVNSGTWTASGFDSGMNPLVYVYRVSGSVQPINVSIHICGKWK